MNNSAKVIVKAHPETGDVITKWEKNGVTYGRIMVAQEGLAINNGYLNTVRRVAFITFDGDALKTMERILKADGAFPLAGTIQVRESLTPFYEGQNPKINPSTDEVMTHKGQPIYRVSEFVSNVDAQDELLANDRTLFEQAVEAETTEDKLQS